MAEQSGYAPARAEALWRKGELASSTAKANAAATLFDAAVEAEAVKHDEIASRAWTKLVFEAGFVGDRYDEAARYARLSESAIRRFGGSDALRADLLDAESNVAYSRGASPEAQRFAREALALREKAFGPSHPDTLQTRSNLADSLWDAGDADEALAMYEALHRARVALLGETHPATLQSLLDIAEAKRELGDYDAALATVERIRAAESADTPELHVAAMRLQLAYTLIPLGKVSEGLSTFESAIAMTGSLRGDESSFVGSHYSTCARVLVQHEDDTVAETYANKALALLAKGEREEEIGEATGVRALCKARRGDAAGAVADAEKALGAKTKQFGARADLDPAPRARRGAPLVASRDRGARRSRARARGRRGERGRPRHPGRRALRPGARARRDWRRSRASDEGGDAGGDGAGSRGAAGSGEEGERVARALSD